MSNTPMRFITVAIHTYDKAIALRSLLENEGIEVVLNNVNLERPSVSSGIRVRIREVDLPLALRIIENHEIFVVPQHHSESSHDILVPVDFSDYTLGTIKIAAEIALVHKSSIVLFNSFIDPYVGGEGVQLTDSLTYEVLDADTRVQIEHTAKRNMESLVTGLKDAMKRGEIPAVKFKTEVVEGVPEDAIAAYVKANQPLLTIMGTRCSDKKEREMVGSVSAEVLDACRFPAISIPENFKSSSALNFSNILFFCNGDQEDIIAMDTFSRLFPTAESKITLAVVPSRRRWLERNRRQSAEILTDYFGNSYPNLKFEFISIDNGKDIDENTIKERLRCYDLIVVTNKKRRNILSRIFTPSLIHRIIFNNDVAMLVIPV